MLRKILEGLLGDLSNHTDRELKEGVLWAIVGFILFAACLFSVHIFA